MQVRIIREGFEDAGDLKIELVVKPDHFIDGICIPEIFAGHIRGEHDGEGVLQTFSGVAFDGLHVEYIGKVFVGEVNLVLVEYLISDLEGEMAYRLETGDLLDIGEFVFEQGGEGWSYGPQVESYRAVPCEEAAGYPVDAV